MKKVLISAPYMVREKELVTRLFENIKVHVHWAEVHERLEEADLFPLIGPYHGIICGDDRITANVLAVAENLEVIVKWGTGIDSIDTKEAALRKITVCRTPNAFSEPVGDTAMALVLAFTRNLFVSDRLMKDGGWDKPQGFCLFEKTVGIIGLGDTGTAMVKRLAVFRPTILANDIVDKDPVFIRQHGVRMVSKEQIYEQADIISLHCDLNPTSFHLLNNAAFDAMKKKPIIINVARGSLIDENALIAALKIGKIAGAGLDVFEAEPLSIDSPLRYMDNVILSSHNANSSPACWQHVHENSVRMLLEGLGIG